MNYLKAIIPTVVAVVLGMLLFNILKANNVPGFNSYEEGDNFDNFDTSEFNRYAA
jgi:hypothetical protein